MKEWFLNLEPRERLILAAGAILAAAILAYGGLWRPLTSATADLRRSVETKERLLVDLQRAAALDVDSAVASPATESSLFATIESSRRAHGLSQPRTTSDGTSIQVTFQREAWDALAGWLVALETEHGVTIETSRVSLSSRQGGHVAATLRLRLY